MGFLTKQNKGNGVIDIFRDEWPFGNMFGGVFNNMPALTSFSTNLVENEDDLVLTADVPGMCEDDIDVSFDNDVLTISCENSECQESDEDATTHWQERCTSKSSRSFRITGVDASNISAELSQGVLTVTLAKQQNTAPASKQIKIKSK